MLRRALVGLVTLAVAGACGPSVPSIPPLPDAGPLFDAGGGTDAGSSASCDNGVRDGDETSLDCGGSCPACADGDNCSVPGDCESGVCQRGRCLVPTCTDGVRNGRETGRDCGGDCGLCPGGEPCSSNDQCLSGRCRGGVCTMSDCEDGRMNGEETDVDCGGATCPACAGGAACEDPEDCESLICDASTCTTAACDDGVQNQDETSVDCGGGLCPPCRDGLACNVDADCEGRRCLDGGCVSCMDGIRDAEETDVDCGGGLCDPCGDGEMCAIDRDCRSDSCIAGVCESCVDGARNQDETDVDCGGSCPGCADRLMCAVDRDCGALGATCVAGVCASCADTVRNRDETDVDCGGPTCPDCADRLMCVDGTDCQSTSCLAGRCVSCRDGVRNQGETDIDCGGTTTCPRCAPGRMCGGATDCASMICDGPTGLCNAPGCGDRVLNGAETDLDCGGGACIGCADGLVCAMNRDCLSGVCTGGRCQVPTCSDRVFNGDETDVDCGGPTTCPRCLTGRRCDATTDCAVDLCDVGYCGGAAMCNAGPARVLVYQPGGTTGTAWFPTGTMTTIASDAMWRTMSTADFGQFDILFIAGGRCGGTLDTVMGTALDTIAAWGPAVQGRVVISSDDADLHGGPQAEAFHRNLVDWLKVPGRNVDAGRTSLYMSWGCTMVNGGGYVPGARGTPETFESVLGTGVSGDGTNYCSSVATTSAGATHPMMAGLSPPFWGCPFHGGLGTIPAGYVSLIDGTTAPNSPVLAVRDSPMPCIP